MASAWANADSLAGEKSEGWKIDLTNGLVSMSIIIDLKTIGRIRPVHANCINTHCKLSWNRRMKRPFETCSAPATLVD
jgi:hypothetical protein